MRENIQMNNDEQGWWSQELRYVRAAVDELKSEVGAVKNKVYNGYSENLEQLRQITGELAETQKEMMVMVHDHDKRLMGCEDHDRRERETNKTRKLQRYRWITVGVSFLGVLAVVLGIFL